MKSFILKANKRGKILLQISSEVEHLIYLWEDTRKAITFVTNKIDNENHYQKSYVKGGRNLSF
jgi:hypothetical protein